mgnify:CR=1 FL=1
MPKHELTREDIMLPEDYEKVRKDCRRKVTGLKKNRRLHIGPDATFYFESYDTMWHQIHEMLYIEKGGEDQIIDELKAYNPLIPNGRELVATLMFEIDDENRRAAFLDGLGGVEETVTITVADETVHAIAEEDVERTTAKGKASSIQFLHFPFSDEQIDLFRQPKARVVVGIGHEKYGHMVKMPEAVRAALALDFDD